MAVKAQYLCSVKVDTSWYRNQHPQHHAITVTSLIVIHQQLEVNAVTDTQVYVQGHNQKDPYQESLYVWLILNMITSRKIFFVKKIVWKRCGSYYLQKGILIWAFQMNNIYIYRIFIYYLSSDFLFISLSSMIFFLSINMYATLYNNLQYITPA